LGIGNAGYTISKYFEKYPQYKVYKIDTQERKEKNYYKLPKQKNIVEYEINTPNLFNFIKSIKGKLLVIIGGSGNISGSLLSILEQLKDKCIISILYIKPDISLLSDIKIKQHEIVYNVLQQQYARTIFEQMIIVDNELLLNTMDVEFENRYEYINENVSYCYHMINTFKNIDSIEDNFEEPVPTANLVSIGYTPKVDIKEGVRRMVEFYKNNPFAWQKQQHSLLDYTPHTSLALRDWCNA
jgi:hypothetical protein